MKTPLHLSFTTALTLLATLASGSPAWSDEPVPAVVRSLRESVEQRDLEAIDWLLGGMIHGLGQDSSPHARELVADWRRQVAAIRHASASGDHNLPQMVRRFVQETATPAVRGMSGGRPVYLLLGFHGAQCSRGMSMATSSSTRPAWPLAGSSRSWPSRSNAACP